MKPVAYLPVLLACCALSSAWAGKADMAVKASVEAEFIQASDAPGSKVNLKGDVQLARGSLRAQGDAGEFTEDAMAYRRFVLSADAGKLVRFRQKLDGAGERWYEGEARRLLYDEKGNVSRLVGAARLRQLEGGVTVRTYEGESLTYDGASGTVTATNTETTESKAGKGRVRMELPL